MNRRAFLSMAGAGAIALTAKLAPQALAAAPERQPALMKVGHFLWRVDLDKLSYLPRHGVTHLAFAPSVPTPNGHWEAQDLRRLKTEIEARGVRVEGVHFDGPIACLMTGEARDRAIANVCGNIRAAAVAGIPSVQYNVHHRVWRPRTDATPGRGGAQYSTWELEKAQADTRRGNVGPITAAELWGRLTYYLEQIIPVAEACQVKMACHPPDPPVPAAGLMGIQQVLNSVDDLKRFVTLVDSDYHGLNFCQGTIAEMLQHPAEEIDEIIRWFGERKKIVNVHFRNIRGARDHFREVYPDEGEMDMFRAMLAYRDVGYTGMLMPDHTPGHADDPGGLQGFAFAFGYINGLIQAANAAR